MDKYHINDHGEPGYCRAEVRCPYGAQEDHYDSAEEARSAYEEKMQQYSFTKISMPKSQDIRLAMAEDPDTDYATLENLVKDPVSRIRRRLASRHDLPSELLDQLSRDSDPLVRRDLGMNPNLSVSTRLALAGDEDEEVQYYSSKAFPCPPEVLEKLASSKFRLARNAAAWTFETPRPILDKLAQDEDPNVVEAARRSIHWLDNPDKR